MHDFASFAERMTASMPSGSHCIQGTFDVCMHLRGSDRYFRPAVVLLLLNHIPALLFRRLVLRSITAKEGIMGRNLTTQELLTLDAVAIRDRYQEGSLTCLGLVTRCLQQIEKHDRQETNLRAVISVAPHDILLQRARLLDEERVAGHERAKNTLHGIPILVKVLPSLHVIWSKKRPTSTAPAGKQALRQFGPS